MAYSTISKPGLHFNTVTYTGNGGTNAITGVGFQPDLVWTKNRSSAQNHLLYDVVRGVGYYLYPNLQNAQGGNGTGGLDSFDSNGFTLDGGDDSNVNGENGVAWSWKAGNSAGSANTDGTINSTVSVNTTAGFSIVKYTGGGSAGTVGHGLSAAPEVVILKSISGSDVWATYHKGIDATAPADYFIQLQSTAARTNNADFFSDTLPTNQVFSIGANSAVSNNGSSFMAYCFAEKKGYSKFGKYIGNGNADGTFVYTGFKPAWVMIKSTSSGSNKSWSIFDTTRQTFNPNVNKTLYANRNEPEGRRGSGSTSSTIPAIDMLSNGFKCRVGNDEVNTTNDYIYMAFAAEPLVANVGQGIPATAR